jgi:hypothetical protein
MISNMIPPQDNGTAGEAFEEWAEPVISELMSLVDQLRTEVTTLRRQVARLQQSAGRGLMHPSDVIEGWR